MASKTVIIVSVIVSIFVAAGVGVLIWWLVRDPTGFSVIELEKDAFGDVEYSAAFTRINRVGDMFWWFYPTTSAAAASKPLLLWLDGVTGLPPSMLANFGMFGPYDFNMNRRDNSWIDEYNLLFVDAPLGTGFSTPLNADAIPKTLDDNADHLTITLNSFYNTHENFTDAPLYIFGQGSGAQLALALATRLQDVTFTHNLKGVILGNGIVSPALALTKLGLYLEEWAYVDNRGRTAVENLAAETFSLVEQGNYGDALDKFLSLGKFVNDEAGAVAVNLGHIVDKLTNHTETNRGMDYFFQMAYLRDLTSDAHSFMDTVAKSLGISQEQGVYDSHRNATIAAVRDTFMIPAVDKVEHILQNTNTTVIIYNGNLDAVSNTPGQLEWVENLQWEGLGNFTNSTRETLVVNRIIEGYFRVTDRLKFYWMNAAGQSVPIDSPIAMRRFLQLITE